MSLACFDDLFAEADRQTARIPIVAAGGADPSVLQALETARRRGWISPVVSGSAADISSSAAETSIDLDGFRVIDSERPAHQAVEEVRVGRAQLLMKGQVSTPQLMQAILDEELGLRTGSTICQVVLMDVPDRDRLFLLADTGICITPTIEQRIEIMNNAISVAHRLECARPRVALMAATETPSALMPETLDALEVCRRMAHDQDVSGWCELPDCYIQGPLSFDLAFDDAASTRKRIEGPVVGRADVLMFPNLVSANLTVKAIMYTANCRFGGILCGASCPVVFMSRSDSTETRLRSIALSLAMLG